MKITPFVTSGIITVALFAATAVPALASTQYSTAYPNYYNNTYGYSGNSYMTNTVTTPYWCGSYWSSQPCTYTNSYSNYQYTYPSPSYNYTYSYPQYQYQNYQYQNYQYQNQYQNNWYGSGNVYYGYNNNVCPVGYYLWGKNCWPNPSGTGQIWYPAY
jgi:hypothetical protein